MFKRKNKVNASNDQSSVNFTSQDFRVELGDKTAPFFNQFSHLIKEIIDELREDFAAVEKKGGIGLKLDDLFVLRHVISEKAKKSNIITAIRKGLAWRLENRELLETLKFSTDEHRVLDVGVEGTELKKEFDFIQDHLAVAFIDGYPSMPHPLFVTRGKFNKMKTIMNNVKKSTLRLYSLLQIEMLYRVVDERTRETGKFIKVINVYDIKDFNPLSKEFDFRFLKAVAENSKHSEYLHPQLLGIRTVLNLPSTVAPVIKLCRKVLSPRARDRIGFCMGRNLQNRQDAGAVCPFVRKHNLGALMPSFLGGEAKCPAALGRDPTKREAKN